MLDPYGVLGLGADADEAAIRAAYRRLARQFHPDVNPAPGSATRMREINAAYELLSDPERRATLQAQPQPVSPPPAPAAPAPAAAPAASAPFASSAAPRPGVRSTAWSGSSISDARRAAYGRRASDPQPAQRANRTVDASAAEAPAASAWQRPAAVAARTARVAAAAPVAVPAAVAAPAARRRPVSLGVMAGAAGGVAVAGLFAFWMVAGTPGGRTASASPAAPAGRPGALQSESVSAGVNVRSAETSSQPRAAGGVTSAQVAGARESQLPLQPLPISAAVGSNPAAPAAGLPSLKPVESAGAVVVPSAPVAPAAPAVAAVAAVSEPAEPAAATVATPVDAVRRSAPVTAQTAPGTSSPAIPVVGGVQGASAPAAPHVQAVASQQLTEPTTTAGATRALSTYDKAWNSYVTALRSTTAGSLAAASGASRASSAASLLSGEGQMGLARASYLDAQLSWSRQMSTTLAAAGAAGTTVARPDGDLAARAEQRLRQAADLVGQAQSASTPVPATQVKALLDEADQLHRASVAEWAKTLSQLP